MQNEDVWENIVIPNSELDGDDLTTKQIRIVFFFCFVEAQFRASEGFSQATMF